MPTELQGLGTYMTLLQSAGQDQFMNAFKPQTQGTGLAMAATPQPPNIDLQGAFAAGESAARGAPNPQQAPAVQRAFARGGAVRGYQQGGMVGLDEGDYYAGDDAGLPPDMMSGGSDEDDLASVSPLFMQLMRAEMSGAGAGEDDGKINKRDAMLALAQAGFATAAGQSPHALSNIGAGGVAGLEALQSMRKERALRRMRETQLQQSGTLRMAQMMQTAELQKARLAQQKANAASAEEYRAWLKQNGMQDNERAQAQFEESKRHNMAMESAARNAPEKLQQSDAFLLPDGSKTKARFNPSTGEYEHQTANGWEKLPPGSQPTTPGVGSPLNRMQYEKNKMEFIENTQAMKKLDSYFANVESADQGYGLIADQISAQVKTALGKDLDPQEFATMKQGAQLQALLGLFRTDIVGPGVMTEYDAQRVLQAIGGDVSLLRNKDIVKSVLQDVFNSKRARTEAMRDNLMYSAPTYGDKIEDFVIPEGRNLFKVAAQKPGVTVNGPPEPSPGDPNAGAAPDLVKKWLTP